MSIDFHPVLPQWIQIRINFFLVVVLGGAFSDSDCQRGLVCFQRDAFETVRGCQGSGKKNKDYCYDPFSTASADPTTFPALMFVAVDAPSPMYPLGVCQGDCDSDSECQPDLLCFNREGTEPVPGCFGSGFSGSDFCYNPRAPQLIAPPTLVPSSAPFNVPTTVSSITNSRPSFAAMIFLQFSLYRRNPVRAVDVLTGREPQLLQAVTNAMLAILCTDTDFVVAQSVNKEDGDYCDSFQNLKDKVDILSVVLRDAAFGVRDMVSGQIEWTQWNCTFTILQVGRLYILAAQKPIESSHDIEEIHHEAVRLMQNTAQQALSASIQEGRLASQISTPGNLVQTSEVGKEGNSFDATDFVHDKGEGNGGGYEIVQRDESKSSSFHTLRVTGIVMLALNVAFLLVLVKLAARQRKNRVLDAECMLRARGGLVTDEGLEYMLNTSREKYQLLASRASNTSKDTVYSEESA